MMRSGSAAVVSLVRLLQLALQVETVTAEPGFFWHITDMHWDPTYDPSTPGVSCTISRAASQRRPAATVGGTRGISGGDYGRYGDYRCDSPWELINSSVEAMNRIKSDVDFLIWTGDDTPHNADQTFDEVSTIISNLTDIITYWFPTSQVYPVLGNHDWSPKNQVPPRAHSFYDRVADMWSHWIGTSHEVHCAAVLLAAGYYSLPVPLSREAVGGDRDGSGLLLIALNTNLYYRSNAEVSGNMSVDPGYQLNWLNKTLERAAQQQQKVILIGHIPPGQFEKHASTTWFLPPYNRAFIDILREHSSVISSAHFAHHHTDSFRLVYDQHDHGTGDAGVVIPVTSFFIAPAVTPWETTLPGVMGGTGNNPGIRLVKYDRSDGRVLDVHQFYLNLTEANELHSSAGNLWRSAYNATEYYGLEDMTSSSLDILAQRLLAERKTFNKYYDANGLFYPEEKGETEEEESKMKEFQVVHYCAITELDTVQYDECIARLSSASTAAAVLFSESATAVAASLICLGFVFKGFAISVQRL